jgi:glycosyltransferase involved in cell wall biosynthesis
MKILLAHNEYQQVGGESQVFAAEGALLEAHDHRVLRYIVHNDQVAEMNPVGLAGATVWNRSNYRELRALIRRERPDVVHFHNTFPLISPSGYYAAKAEGRPVVQSLHNYRLLCPNALFFRDGRACEDCHGKLVPWPGVLHACYRGSRPASGAVAAMLTAHRTLRTWTRMVDVYIALTEFARGKFVQGGLLAEKIVVKPNFLHPDPNPGERRGGYAVFVGRLSVEKGIDGLLSAWERLGDRMPLKIVGDGPLAEIVARDIRRLKNVEWLGRRPREQALDLMKGARVLILPSICYENFPLVVAEAFAVGLPIIASDLGSLASLVDPGRTGLLFRPSDPKDLADKVEWALNHPNELASMSREARAEFEAKYTAERNYERLLSIYESAAEGKGP